MKCPYCNVPLVYQDSVDTDFYNCKYYEEVLGRCSVCDRLFSWIDVYAYEYSESLKEEN